MGGKKSICRQKVYYNNPELQCLLKQWIVIFLIPRPRIIQYDIQHNFNMKTLKLFLVAFYDVNLQPLESVLRHHWAPVPQFRTPVLPCFIPIAKEMMVLLFLSCKPYIMVNGYLLNMTKQLKRNRKVKTELQQI